MRFGGLLSPRPTYHKDARFGVGCMVVNAIGLVGSCEPIHDLTWDEAVVSAMEQWDKILTECCSVEHINDRLFHQC